MPVERAMGSYQKTKWKIMGKDRLWAPGEEIFFLVWSFPNCFLAPSVILVERFQLPNPNPNP